jgi:hypothetical protein
MLGTNGSVAQRLIDTNESYTWWRFLKIRQFVNSIDTVEVPRHPLSRSLDSPLFCSTLTSSTVDSSRTPTQTIKWTLLLLCLWKYRRWHLCVFCQFVSGYNSFCVQVYFCDQSCAFTFYVGTPILWCFRTPTVVENTGFALPSNFQLLSSIVEPRFPFRESKNCVVNLVFTQLKETIVWTLFHTTLRPLVAKRSTQQLNFWNRAHSEKWARKLKSFRKTNNWKVTSQTSDANSKRKKVVRLETGWRAE